MNIYKQVKDLAGKAILKRLYGNRYVPRELYELSSYFRMHGAINFTYHKEEDTIVAVSTNYRFGSIVTSGKTKKDLEKNIIDAILTSFDLPAAYQQEAKVHNVSTTADQYAFA